MLLKMIKVLQLFLCIIILIFSGLSSCNKPEEELSLKKPNILFCIANDASFEHMGAYDYT